MSQSTTTKLTHGPQNVGWVLAKARAIRNSVAMRSACLGSPPIGGGTSSVYQPRTPAYSAGEDVTKLTSTISQEEIQRRLLFHGVLLSGIILGRLLATKLS